MENGASKVFRSKLRRANQRKDCISGKRPAVGVCCHRGGPCGAPDSIPLRPFPLALEQAEVTLNDRTQKVDLFPSGDSKWAWVSADAAGER